MKTVILFTTEDKMSHRVIIDSTSATPIIRETIALDPLGAPRWIPRGDLLNPFQLATAIETIVGRAPELASAASPSVQTMQLGLIRWAPSTSKDVTRFSILGVDGAISGQSITLELPFGTDLSKLSPTIVSTGVSISPASGVAEDFTSPVTYTVTAQDNSTKTYTVVVTVAPNNTKDITQLVIDSVSGSIDGTNIAVVLPLGTDVTSLSPEITMTGVSLSPTSGVAQDFTSPVTYTVAAADGSSKSYVVTVQVASA